LQQFHDGAFRLAADTGKLVIPTVILFTKTVLPQHKTFYFWPHRLEMHFLPPVHPQQKTPQALKEEVYEQMKNFYESHH
jgi:1-acyl-sn-glycerol-3-phosphate acyltransferase